MKFGWDEAKRRANLRKHGIDFNGIETVFDGATMTIEDNRFEYGEQRFVTFGLLEGRLVAIAHTETEDLIRIISARKATRSEEALFFERLPD